MQLRTLLEASSLELTDEPPDQAEAMDMQAMDMAAAAAMQSGGLSLSTTTEMFLPFALVGLRHAA